MGRNGAAGIQVDRVRLVHLSGSADIHDEVKDFVNNDITQSFYRTDIGADRCTVIITTPKTWFGSFSAAPGHCGVALWNSQDRRKPRCQSFGIWLADDGDTGFGIENVTAVKGGLKTTPDYCIEYFTKEIDPDTNYIAMRDRMIELVNGTKPTYGKFFVSRHFGGYSCVTAVDTILCAGDLSRGVASQTSTPWMYARTFSLSSWQASYVDNMKNI